MKYRIKLTVTESRCRGGYCREGDEFIIDDICPPICHELWNVIYPNVFALGNGAELDCQEERARGFEAACPDGGRVRIKGEVIRE